jgi:hypothetical protein
LRNLNQLDSFKKQGIMTSLLPHAAKQSTQQTNDQELTEPASNSPSSVRSWSLFAVVASAIALISAGMIVGSLKTHNIIHIRSDDVSASAEPYTILRQHHCQLSSEHYQPGDMVVDLLFADHSEIAHDITVSNGLSLLGHCNDLKIPPSVGQQRGTSLILALKYIQTIIANKRALGNTNPIVVTITLQATEPGSNQPDPHDFKTLRNLVQAIVNDRGVLTIIGTTGQLQNDLSTHLQGLPNQRTCPVSSLNECVKWAFETGRKL